MKRRIKFNRILNFRDLGGYECRYGVTAYNVVYRSGRLSDADEDDIRKLESLHLSSIIDLRDEAAKSELPELSLLGAKLISLPVNGAGRIPADQDDQVRSYMEMVEEPCSARRIFQAILNAPKPTVIHCNAGKDRTGVFALLLLLANGVDIEDINADYLASFAYLHDMEKRVKDGLTSIPPFIIVPDEFYLDRFLERFFERYENLDGYFEAIGLSEDEIRGLSSLLGKQEKSCGAVLFFEGKVCVEHMAAGHYSIPKGHVEPEDLSEEMTALREIKEELGVEASILPGFRESIVYSPSDGVIKEVVFFAAQTQSEDFNLQEDEVQDAYWVSPADAVRFLTHDSDRRIVTSAAYFEAGDCLKKVAE